MGSALDWLTKGVKVIVPSGEAMGLSADRAEPNGEPQPMNGASARTRMIANLIGCTFDNGRFLRHRPKRSGRCLDYVRLYQVMARCQCARRASPATGGRAQFYIEKSPRCCCLWPKRHQFQLRLGSLAIRVFKPSMIAVPIALPTTKRRES